MAILSLPSSTASGVTVSLEMFAIDSNFVAENKNHRPKQSITTLCLTNKARLTSYCFLFSQPLTHETELRKLGGHQLQHSGIEVRVVIRVTSGVV